MFSCLDLNLSTTNMVEHNNYAYEELYSDFSLSF